MSYAVVGLGTQELPLASSAGIHVRMYVCVCLYACLDVCTCVCMFVCMQIRTYVCMHACMDGCMYVCMHVYHACRHVYVCIYIYTDIYIYMYIDIYIYIHAGMDGWMCLSVRGCVCKQMCVNKEKR